MTTDGTVKCTNTEREAVKLSGEDCRFGFGGFSGSAGKELTLDDSRGESLIKCLAFGKSSSEEMASVLMGTAQPRLPPDWCMAWALALELWWWESLML